MIHARSLAARSRWRAGKIEEVTLSVPVLGSFSATAPYDCAKSQRIFAQGLRTLAAGSWMQEFGAWYHDLARCPDGGFTHQGPPEPGYDSYRRWDASGAYLLAYVLPQKKIILTGKNPVAVQSLEPTAAQSLVADGRGWDNKDRTSTYDQFADAELLARLGSWWPIVRERAAAAIARRKQPPLSAIISLLDSENLDVRIGACHALEALRGTAAPAVPQLQRMLQHDDLWLRVRAATVLALQHIEEGIQASADYLRTQNPLASERRTPQILEVLTLYAAEAQRVVPHLRETAEMFDRGEKQEHKWHHLKP